MESLESLKSRLKYAENELASITIKRSGSTPWAPGVQDQHKSDSYQYEEYTDPSKAYRLKEEIADLKRKIDTYAERARIEREREEALIESSKPKFDYTSAGKEQTSSNPAIAARYNAQQRLFGMSKVKKTLMTLTGQKRKFHELWNKANTTNKNTQEQVASELNRMFR